MPTPSKGESEKSFIARCVSQVIKEGKPQKEALGRCFGIFRNSKKKKKGALDNV